MKGFWGYNWFNRYTDRQADRQTHIQGGKYQTVCYISQKFNQINIYLFELFLLPFRDQPFDEQIINRNVTTLPGGIRLRAVIQMLLMISGIETNPGPPIGQKRPCDHTSKTTACKPNNA